MICVFPADAEDFTGNGAGMLSPTKCEVSETLNGGCFYDEFSVLSGAWGSVVKRHAGNSAVLQDIIGGQLCKV